MPIIRNAPALTLPSDSPGADLPAVLEPYLWLNEVTPVWYGRKRLAYVQVAGIVKMQGELPGPAEPANQGAALALANAVRQSLFGAAQTAVCAAEDAGYLHERCPEIDIGGDMHRIAERGIECPVVRVTLRMWLRPARG